MKEALAEAFREAGLDPVQIAQDVADVDANRDGDPDRGQRLMDAYGIMSRVSS